MTSKINPEVPIELGGKLRHLRLDVNAMVLFEEETGLNLMNPDAQKKLVRGGLTVKEFRAFLWACLVHEDESLTQPQVGSWFNAGNMGEIAGKLNEAIAAAAPEPQEVAETVPLAKKKSRRG